MCREMSIHHGISPLLAKIWLSEFQDVRGAKNFLCIGIWLPVTPLFAANTCSGFYYTLFLINYYRVTNKELCPEVKKKEKFWSLLQKCWNTVQESDSRQILGS